MEGHLQRSLLPSHSAQVTEKTGLVMRKLDDVVDVVVDGSLADADQRGMTSVEEVLDVLSDQEGSFWVTLRHLVEELPSCLERDGAVEGNEPLGDCSEFVGVHRASKPDCIDSARRAFLLSSAMSLSLISS